MSVVYCHELLMSFVFRHNYLLNLNTSSDIFYSIIYFLTVTQAICTTACYWEIKERSRKIQGQTPTHPVATVARPHTTDKHLLHFLMSDYGGSTLNLGILGKINLFTNYVRAFHYLQLEKIKYLWIFMSKNIEWLHDQTWTI